MALGALSMFLPPSPAGAHDQVYRQSASGGQCRGDWHADDDHFWILDNDVFDSDYCYIDYRWANVGGGGRFSAVQDVGGWQGPYNASPPGGATGVEWRVCKERQNDPDICSGWTVSPK